MPTGFNVESGAAFSVRLKNLIPWMEAKLKTATPISPVTARDICLSARLEGKGDIEGSHVRAMVNFMRRASMPIASVAEGYFWACECQQLDSTIQHLTERIQGISSALNGLVAARSVLALKKGQLDLL